MNTILTTHTAHWDICRHRCFARNERQIKTAGGTELHDQRHTAPKFFCSVCNLKIIATAKSSRWGFFLVAILMRISVAYELNSIVVNEVSVVG